MLVGFGWGDNAFSTAVGVWLVGLCVFGVSPLSAVVPLGGFAAGTVLSLIPLWGVGGVAVHCRAG
jgi:hypothetical protein